MSDTITAKLQELDDLILACDAVISDLTAIETATANMLTDLLSAYRGGATPIIEDMQKPLKGHISMLKECYNTVKSYVFFAKQALEAQDRALAEDLD